MNKRSLKTCSSIMSFAWFFIIFVVLSINPNSAHEYVGQCFYYEYSCPYRCNLTFICVENELETNFFKPDANVICRNSRYGISKTSIGTINFLDCEQPPIPSNIFEMYTSVHTFNISYLGLTSLQVDDFEGAKNLVRFIAAHNEITEIPSFLFHKTEKLVDVDFSWNRIERIDDFAFYSDIHLEKLNLSYNRLTGLSKQILDIHSNLTHLDLSFNQISSLKADTFENLRKLVLLDLSGNLIRKFDSKTFTNLVKLQYLNVSHNNLTEVKPGTFSSLTKLQTLDLSSNQIRKLDAAILPTHSVRLKLLIIERNQLQELNGFTNAHFPDMKIFGIDTNQFSCAFLKQFFQLITPKNLGNISTKLNCSSNNDATEPNEISTISSTEASTKVQVKNIVSSKTSATLITTTTEILNEVQQPFTQQTPEPITKPPQIINNTIQHYNTTVVKVYGDEETTKHLHITTWINTAGLIIVVIALIWILLRKRTQEKNTFANVLYSQSHGESTNTIEQNEYGNNAEK